METANSCYNMNKNRNKCSWMFKTLNVMMQSEANQRGICGIKHFRILENNSEVVTHPLQSNVDYFPITAGTLVLCSLLFIITYTEIRAGNVANTDSGSSWVVSGALCCATSSQKKIRIISEQSMQPN